MEQLQVDLKSCPRCAAQMPGHAAFCPGCGRSMQTPISQVRTPREPTSQVPNTQAPSPKEPTREHGKVGILPENIAGAMAYLTFVPAIVLLLVEPYRRNQFVRFHSLQCLMFSFAALALAAVLRLTGLVLVRIPVLGPLLVLLVDVVVALAVVLLWLVLLVKALQGERMGLPLLGAIAEQHSEVS